MLAGEPAAELTTKWAVERTTAAELTGLVADADDAAAVDDSVTATRLGAVAELTAAELTGAALSVAVEVAAEWTADLTVPTGK